MRPQVAEGLVISYPTDEEAEYPGPMCQKIAKAVKEFIDRQPELLSSCK